MKYLYTSILIIIYSLLSSMLIAQDNPFYSSLDESLNNHIQGQGFDDSFKAIDGFEKIIQDNPERWEPHFWASYVYTQIARGITRPELSSKNLTRADLLNSSQMHLDMAKESMIKTSNDLKSDYHTLQSLIYTFQKAYAQSDQEQFEYASKEKSEMNEALKANPDNPVAWVLVGSDMFSVGLQESDYGKVAAARLLLSQAGEIFEQNKKAYLTQNTYWNVSWYKFWLGRSDRFLNSGL